MQSSMSALRHGTADALFADPQDKKDKEQLPTVRKALRERLLRVGIQINMDVKWG